MKRIRVGRSADDQLNSESRPFQEYHTFHTAKKSAPPTRFPPRSFGQRRVEVEVESGTIKVKTVTPDPALQPTIKPNPLLKKVKANTKKPIKAHKGEPKTNTPEVRPTQETKDLANDEFFFKKFEDEAREEKELKNHSFKADVELFDVATQKNSEDVNLPKNGKPGSARDSKSKDSDASNAPKGKGDGKNYEFIQNPTQLDKNDKFLKSKRPKCYECDASVYGVSEEDDSDSDDQKLKIIDDFKSRILNKNYRG